MSQRSFPLLGSTLLISDERDQYNEAHHQFDLLSVKVADKFIEVFNSSCSSLSDLIEKSEGIAAKLYLEAAGEVAGMLSQKGIYSLDKNTIYSQYLSQHCFKNWLLAMKIKNDNIEYELEEKNEMRAENHANRPRVHGHDVCLGNPMTDTLVAGAADLTIGAVSGAFNLIGAGISAINANMKKSELFKDPKTIKTLYDSVENDIYSCIDEYMDEVKKNGKGSFDPVSEEESNHAENLANNLMDGHIPEEKRKELIIEALSNDPYNTDIFMYAYKEYGDENGEITTIAQYLYHDTDAMKEDIVSDIIEGDITSEEDALATKELVIEKMKYLSASRSLTLGVLNKLIKEFDDAAHRYRGHMYDTREECEIAKAQDKVLADKCAGITLMDHDSAVKLSIEISESDDYPQIKMPYINALGNHIANLENSELYALCTAAQMADKTALIALRDEINNKGYAEETTAYYTEFLDKHIVNRDDGEMLMLCAALLTSDENTVRELENRIREADINEATREKYLGFITDRLNVIWAEEDGRHFRDVVKSTNVNDAAAIQRTIEYISSNGRTEAKQEFIDALGQFNAENISIARKYSKNKKKGFLNTFVMHAVFSIKNKKLWDTITVRNTVIHPALLEPGVELADEEYTAPPINGKATMKSLPNVATPKNLSAVKKKSADIVYPKDNSKPVCLSSLQWDENDIAALTE